MGFEQTPKEKVKQKEVLNDFVVVNESESLNMDAFRGGMDFYLQGGKSEAESVVNHLRSLKGVEIPQEKYDRLLTLERPPQPDFEVKTHGQVKAMGKRERKRYKERMDAFEARRKAWDETDAGKAWANALNEATSYGEAMQMQKEAYRLAEESGYEDIDDDPDLMDEKLQETDTEEFLKKDDKISQLEILAATKLHAPGNAAIGWYINLTAVCKDMNHYMRTGELRKNGRGKEVVKWAEDAKKFLNNASLSRDIVSRRAVRDAQTIGFMLGLKNAQSLTPDEIKKELKNRIASGDDVMMEEKGFCSTSVSADDMGYYAGDQLNSETIGVEFIILNKKGTRGINFAQEGGSIVPSVDKIAIS